MRSPLLRPLAATLAILLALAVYQAMGLYNRAMKASDAVIEGILANGGAAVITLRFEPDQFHISLIQDTARLVEVQRNRIFVLNLTEDDVLRVAGWYWTMEVAPWERG